MEFAIWDLAFWELAVWLLALAASSLLAVPTIVYAAECIFGSLPRSDAPRPAIPRAAVAVLVPAHDEEQGIAATLRNIAAQLRDGDRLLVVADNCSDRTAAVARAAGAEVVERHDPSNRGKGYALDFGLAHLARDPRPVVVIIDADCRLLAGALDELSRTVTVTGRPAQSCYLMVAGSDRNGRFGVAQFAFLVKNLVRPRGLARIGLPCQMTGAGMALPWAAVGTVDLAHGHLVEDMKLGLDLAAAGYAPVFCEDAGVRSDFPESTTGAESQRRRWEHGHLAMLAASGRHLLDRRVLGNPNLLAMTLDVLVPPLTLLAACIAAVVVLGALVAALGFGLAPLAVSAASGVLLVLATAVAWAAHGRQALPARAALKIPGYMLGKVGLYPRALAGKSEQEWVRTDRTRT